eukprot:3750-Eustigmatos_ZCMA.PRE.1
MERINNTKHSSESTRKRLQKKMADRKAKAADEPEQPSPMYSTTLGVARLQQQTNVLQQQTTDAVRFLTSENSS